VKEEIKSLVENYIMPSVPQSVFYIIIKRTNNGFSQKFKKYSLCSDVI